MKKECLICEAPLVYLESDKIMVCTVCHKKENSNNKNINSFNVIISLNTEKQKVVFSNLTVAVEFLFSVLHIL